MGLAQVLAISDTQDNGEETRSVVSNSPARLVADMASLLLGVDQAPTSVRGATRRGADGSTRPSSNPQKDWPHLSYSAPATPRSPARAWQPALRVCEACGTTGPPMARQVRRRHDRSACSGPSPGGGTNAAPDAGASPSPPPQRRGLTSLAPGQADPISLKYGGFHTFRHVI